MTGLNYSADEIEALKQQVADLKKSEAFFRAITQNSSDIIIVVNKRAEIIYVNSALEQYLGYRPDDIIGKSGFDYIIPSDIPRAILDFSKSLLTKEIKISNSFGIRHKDGSTRILEGIGVNLLHDGIVKGFVMNVHDVTDRRRAEMELETYRRHLESLVEERTAEISMINARLLSELSERTAVEKALQESEAKYRDFIENAPIGVSIIDMRGKVVYINKRIENAMGWARDRILGKDCFSLESFDDKTREILLKTVTAGKRGDKPGRLEIPIIRKNKSPLLVEVIATVLKKNGVPASMQIVFVDITERKCAEEERRNLLEKLHRAEKLESLGTLAGGVAHDLNNVLGALVGYTQLMLSKMDERDYLTKYLHNIMKSSEKGTAIIQDLLTLARRGVNVPAEIVNLNDVLTDFFQTPEFERMGSYHPLVTFKTTLADDLLNIKGMPVHLAKTVMNLISNATEAITGEGRVTITTGNTCLNKPIPGYVEIHSGDYVTLTVSDSGQGILPADIGKIFEPFYTKKVMGRSGTGLGLAVVWGTVKDHKGYIDVQSEPGKGSTFTLYFPATSEAVKIISQIHISSDSYRGRGETVLIVDDLNEQREIASNLLEKLGYQVNALCSGEDAVEYLKNRTTDILVLDMLMEPGIDGLETYRRIQKIHPNQRAIIVSGFSETDRVKQALRLGVGAYIQKPYRLEDIGIAIRKVLSESSQSPA